MAPVINPEKLLCMSFAVFTATVGAEELTDDRFVISFRSRKLNVANHRGKFITDEPGSYSLPLSIVLTVREASCFVILLSSCSL